MSLKVSECDELLCCAVIFDDIILVVAVLFCVFAGYYKLSSTDSYFYAAIVAIVAVHVLLSMFIYVAWNEGSKASVATYKSD